MGLLLSKFLLWFLGLCMMGDVFGIGACIFIVLRFFSGFGWRVVFVGRIDWMVMLALWFSVGVLWCLLALGYGLGLVGLVFIFLGGFCLLWEFALGTNDCGLELRLVGSFVWHFGW